MLRAEAKLSQDQMLSPAESNTQNWVDQWIHQYKTNFISCIIGDGCWAKTVEDALETGLFDCNEARLRRKEQLQHSERYKEIRRSIVNSSFRPVNISAIYSYFKQGIIERPTETTLKNQTLFLANGSFGSSLYLFNEENFSAIQKLCKIQIAAGITSFPIKLSDGNEYKINLEENGKVRKIDGIPSLLRTKGDHDWVMETERLQSQFKIPNRAHVEIAADMSSPTPIDKNIALIWEISQQLKSDEPGHKLFDRFNAMRSDFGIEASSNLDIAHHVRVNDIPELKSDSSLLLLRGNANHLLSHAPSEKGSRYLLFPWENHGELFSLSLDQEETLVLGTKALLSPYVDKTVNNIVIQLHPLLATTLALPLIKLIADYARSNNYFYFEELSASQLNFFKIPQAFSEVNQQPQTRVFDKESTRLPQSVLAHGVCSFLDEKSLSAAAVTAKQLKDPAYLQFSMRAGRLLEQEDISASFEKAICDEKVRDHKVSQSYHYFLCKKAKDIDGMIEELKKILTADNLNDNNPLINSAEFFKKNESVVKEIVLGLIKQNGINLSNTIGMTLLHQLCQHKPSLMRLVIAHPDFTRINDKVTFRNGNGCMSVLNQAILCFVSEANEIDLNTIEMLLKHRAKLPIPQEGFVTKAGSMFGRLLQYILQFDIHPNKYCSTDKMIALFTLLSRYGFDLDGFIKLSNEKDGYSLEKDDQDRLVEFFQQLKKAIAIDVQSQAVIKPRFGS